MLMEQLPTRVYSEETHVADLQHALERPLTELADCRDEMLRQIRVSTADSWGLALWERAYGLTVSTGREMEWRRARVLARMRGNATTTRTVLERIAVGFSPDGATVTEIPAEYRLELVLHNSNGARDTIEAVIHAMEEVKPAHLEMSLRLQQRVIGRIHLSMRARVGSNIHVRPYQPASICATASIGVAMHIKGAHRLHTYSKGE